MASDFQAPLAWSCVISHTINKEQANLYCRRAVQLITDAGVLPVPRMFQLFFEYAEGANEPLNGAMEVLLQNTPQPAPSELELLFETYLKDPADQRNLDDMGEKLGDEVRTALDVVRDAASSADNFSQSVKAVEAGLGDGSDAGAVQRSVQELTNVAREMSAQSAEMNSILSDSAEQIEYLKGALDQVRLESQKDSLTGLANRKCFDRTLFDEMEEAAATGCPLSLCMIDVDHFKQFNDSHGHRAGDAALRIVASLFKYNVRNQDLVARYGGEEFALILPNAALETASQIAERIGTALAKKEIVRRANGEKLGCITVSTGVALLRKDDTLESFIERADRALYEAKRTGRNKVETEAPLITIESRANDRVA